MFKSDYNATAVGSNVTIKHRTIKYCLIFKIYIDKVLRKLFEEQKHKCMLR